MPLYVSSIVRTELTSFWEAHKEGKVYIMGIVHSHGDEGKLAFLKKCNTRHLPPKIFHNLCFSFLLGITAFPSEIENSAYSKFWGANKVYYGNCGSSV